MQQRLTHPPSDFPGEVVEAGRDAFGQVGDGTHPRPVLGDLHLGAVSGTGAGEHPFPPVPVTKSGPDLQVVAPLLELGCCVDLVALEAPGFGLVGRGGMERDLGEPGVDERRGVRVEDVRADRPALFASRAGAGVADKPFGVDGPDQDPPAVRAPGEAGQEPVVVSPLAVPRPVTVVGLGPEFSVDDRRPGVLDPQSSGADEHAERGLGAHDAHDGGRRPIPLARRGRLTGQVVGDLAPPRPSGPLCEDPPHRLGLAGVDDGLAGLGASVAVGAASGEPAGGHGTDLRGGQRLVGLVALPCGHDEQQSEHRPADGSGGIDLFGHRHDPGAFAVEFLDGRQSADDGPGEPVKASDDHTPRLALLDELEGLVHAGPVHRPPGPVKVFEPRPDPDAVCFGPAVYRCALLGRGLEAFPGSAGDRRDPDVAGQWEAHRRGIVQRHGLSAGPARAPHKALRKLVRARAMLDVLERTS